MMRRLILMAAMAFCYSSVALAQTPSVKASSDVCVGVGIGNAPPDNLACLNAKLRQQALAAKGQADQSVVLQSAGPRDTGPGVNVFNETATQERLGNAFWPLGNSSASGIDLREPTRQWRALAPESRH